MATHSSARVMENLQLVYFADHILEPRTTGANIGRPGINDYLAGGKAFRLDDESRWEKGSFALVYYMPGARATAYLIPVQGIDEKTVLKDWYFDILRHGKSAAFEKHMGISLQDFYRKFDAFIRQSEGEVTKILNQASHEKSSR